MRHTIGYYGAITFSWLIFGAVPAILLPELGISTDVALLISILAGACVVFAVDKKMDNSWRGTVAINESKSV